MEYDFSLIGSTALLMHADDVEQSDVLAAWRNDPKNASLSVKGDDRSPAWSWMTYLYSDGTHLSVPSDNLMVALRYAAAKIPHKKGSSFKALSQSCLLIREEHLRLTIDGNQVALADCLALKDRPFSEQSAAVRNLGFSLFVKRAKVGQSKHVRVRPRFDVWEVRGSVEATDPAITDTVLGQMLSMAGMYAGLCDWRPASPKSPGSFGLFEARLTPSKSRRKSA